MGLLYSNHKTCQNSFHPSLFQFRRLQSIRF
jgi:hypothetical protein